MTILTLTTDFGLQDGFVGVMKGVILSICPQASLVDISHDIPPQDIQTGGLTLARAFSYFPSGTIHLAVVDPGVGTDRRSMAARLGKQFFVGPDNGLCTLLIESIEKQGGSLEFIHLTNPEYWLPSISPTFHGRDIFAASAAHLARGVPLSAFGDPITDPIRLHLPQPEKIPGGWRAHITSIDRFGNLSTDLPGELLNGNRSCLVRIAGREIHGLAFSYGENGPGDLIALINSAGFLEIAIVNASAAHATTSSLGSPIDILL